MSNTDITSMYKLKVHKPNKTSYNLFDANSVSKRTMATLEDTENGLLFISKSFSSCHQDHHISLTYGQGEELYKLLKKWYKEQSGGEFI